MKKEHFAELRRISENIPKELLDNITKKVQEFATLKEICERGVKEPDDVVPPKEKRRLQEILDSGYLDKQVEVVDRDVENLIDEWFGFEIEKAVKEGRLPPHVEAGPEFTSAKNKGKQYARRQTARLRELFSGEVQGVESASQEGADGETEHGGRGGNEPVLPTPSGERAG